MRYTDLGHDYYERERSIARQVRRHVAGLDSLGYEVTLTPRPDPAPDATEGTQAA
jgi:hypothetical protein